MVITKLDGGDNDRGYLKASASDEPTKPCSRLVPVSNPGYNGLWPHRSKGRTAEGVFAMPAASVLTSSPRSFDASGRALPLTPEEIDQRAALALQALDALEDMGDEEEQRETFAYLARAVNEDRLSDRPRFGS